MTPLNHLASLIEAKESASNRSEAHTFRVGIVAKPVAIDEISKLAQIAGAFDLKQLQDDASICRSQLSGPTSP